MKSPRRFHLLASLLIAAACVDEPSPAPSVDADVTDADPAPDTSFPDGQDEPHLDVDAALDAPPPDVPDAAHDGIDAPDEPPGVQARFERLEGDDFYRLPWPLDARTLAGGHPDLSDFPGPQKDLVDDWIALVEREVVGFAAMPVIYVPFSGALDAASLPVPPETLAAGASVRLFSLADCTTRAPVYLEFRPSGDFFRNDDVLLAVPVPGFPLAPGPWGFVATGLSDAAGEPVVQSDGLAQALDGTHPDAVVNEAFEPLRSCFETAGLAVGAIAAATVFTVQDARAGLLAVRNAAVDPETTPAPEVTDFAADSTATEGGRFRSWSGSYETPIYQRGETPYTRSGGGFVFDGEGRPQIQRWESVPFLVTVPFHGDGPFPVLIWMDGTGASLRHHLGGDPMRDALDAGLAVVSFTPQFTDGRAVPDADPSLHGFNWVNGEAGRTVFRQQAVDTSYFIRVLREALPTDAGLPELDTSRLAYAGQSQGSLIGAFLAGVEPEISAYGLNGTGAYLSATVVERKDPVDYASLLRGLLGVSDTIDVFHPVVQLIQLGGETVDPLSYIRAWSGSEENGSGAHILLLNGDEDPTTPRTLVDAMIIAGDLAPIDPAGWDPDPLGVWPREAEPLPIQGNRAALDSSPLTRAAFLAAGLGHFTIYDVAAARALLIDFLVSSYPGVPLLSE